MSNSPVPETLPVVTLADRRPEERPIFIVGCQRSGTTLLRLMLDSHPRISCGPETRFLAPLARATEEQWRRLANFGFPEEYWHRAIARFFDGIQSDYAHQRGKVRWADKTPRYALELPRLDRLFPRCQVIHVLRDGRDVVASHRARWGWRAAARAVEKWPRYVREAQAAGADLGPERYLEVRYERLVGEPEATMRRILEFLGEPWDEAVLHHEDHPHDVAEKYRAFSGERRRAAAEGGAVYRNRVGSHRKELDPLLRLGLRLRAGSLLTELGYRAHPRP